MPGRRLRRLGLEPAHRLAAGVAERVHAPGARPGDVAPLQPVRLTVEHRVGGAGQDQVRLLERMVMRPGHPVRLVLHHEHGLQLCSEVGVDHHLHRDPAVHQPCGPHADLVGRRTAQAGRRDVAERPSPRILQIRPNGPCFVPQVHPHRVAVVMAARLRRQHVGPPRGHAAVVAPGVRHADRKEPVVVRAEQERAFRRGQHDLAVQDEEGLLERVDVPGQAPARLELADPEAGVNRPDLRSDLIIDGRPAPRADGRGSPLGRTEETGFGGPQDEMPGGGHAFPDPIAASRSSLRDPTRCSARRVRVVMGIPPSCGVIVISDTVKDSLPDVKRDRAAGGTDRSR